jgi:dTDP-4-dehydrorhamnose reductase
MIRMLITGGKGMVGGYAPKVFPDYEILSTDLDTLDIRSPESIARTFKDFHPEVLLHLAAATDVDRCEQDPDWAVRSNEAGTRNLAQACLEHGALMVYASTGAVFQGDKPEPYTEFDPTGPSNVYAASKLAGEKALSGLLERHCIVRAGWMFGGGAADKKFVGKIATQIALGRTVLKAVNDKFGSPTYAKDFLEAVRRILKTGAYGVFHAGNGGRVSRFDIAREIARILGRTGVLIAPVSSKEFPLPAPRGTSEALYNKKLELLGLEPQRPWQEALAEYLRSEILAG